MSGDVKEERVQILSNRGELSGILAVARRNLSRHRLGAQGTYFFQRAIQHGRRRAEEMSESAQTVREIGLEPWSAAGTAERQSWVADLAEAGVFGERGTPGFARRADWRIEADRILAQSRAVG